MRQGKGVFVDRWVALALSRDPLHSQAPVSRESLPNQFVPLVGQESTFQQVLARISHPGL